MANRADITPELLRELLRYEPETGKLFWRKRSLVHFSSEGQRDRWNMRYAEKEAMTAIDADGYLRGLVYAVRFCAHRVAFAIYHGEHPDGQIDHINHDRTDNRINNLRAVSIQGNNRNRSQQRNNTSGVMGVSWDEKRRKWKVKIQKKHLGYFSSKEDAVAARREADALYGFHENHGSGHD